MTRSDRRRFTLADLMVLIAVVAVFWPLGRWVETNPPNESGLGYTSFRPPNWAYWVWARDPSYFVVPLTLVLVPLRWLGPRPRASRVLGQPGAVACLAAAGAMVAALVIELAEEEIRAAFLRPGEVKRVFAQSWYWVSALNPVPLAIMGAWSALAICGRWSAEASWIDRLGRILGIFWIVKFPISFFLRLLNHWWPYQA